MRLFTAILFDDETKDALCDVMDKLRSVTEKGNFTLRDNLHLTLNFIGETDKAKLVEKAMKEAVEAADISAFNLTFSGFGRFKRREGDICWVGVERNETLIRLQKELAERLINASFALDGQDYTPHLTLARKARFGNKFSEREFAAAVPGIKQHVGRISLMKSERINGKLTYTEIFYVKLN